MGGVSWHRCCTVELTMWVDKLERVKKIAALVALVTSSIVVLTSRTCSFHIAVCKEGLVLFTIWLCSCPLPEVAILVELCKDILCDHYLLFCSSPPEVVESNFEPVIYVFVFFVVLIAELFRRLTRFKGFRLCCCTVFVCAAYEQSWSIS